MPVMMGPKSVKGPAIQASTAGYEAWLRQHIHVYEPHLKEKHRRMRKSLLGFLRATYYHWAAVWPVECKDLRSAPIVTSVGDLHVENFGTWRDSEGRLAWGVNDLDEAAPLPYTNDLVRLATSAVIAAEQGSLKLSGDAVCNALLTGYGAAIQKRGKPVILAEGYRELGEHVVRRLVNPEQFWSVKLGRDLKDKPRVSRECSQLLDGVLPDGARPLKKRARVAGAGSLGRPRFVVVAQWGGARVAREAKAFVPSATFWAQGAPPPKPPDAYAQQLLDKAVRSRDPYLKIVRSWVIRRLAPDADKIKLESLESRKLERQLLMLMGADTANIHLGTRGAGPAISRDLRQRGRGWLDAAMRRMLMRTQEDYQSLRCG